MASPMIARAGTAEERRQDLDPDRVAVGRSDLDGVDHPEVDDGDDRQLRVGHAGEGRPARRPRGPARRVIGSGPSPRRPGIAAADHRELAVQPGEGRSVLGATTIGTRRGAAAPGRSRRSSVGARSVRQARLLVRDRLAVRMPAVEQLRLAGERREDRRSVIGQRRQARRRSRSRGSPAVVARRSTQVATWRTVIRSSRGSWRRARASGAHDPSARASSRTASAVSYSQRRAMVIAQSPAAVVEQPGVPVGVRLAVVGERVAIAVGQLGQQVVERGGVPQLVLGQRAHGHVLLEERRDAGPLGVAEADDELVVGHRQEQLAEGDGGQRPPRSSWRGPWAWPGPPPRARRRACRASRSRRAS